MGVMLEAWYQAHLLVAVSIGPCCWYRGAACLMLFSFDGACSCSAWKVRQKGLLANSFASLHGH